MVKRVIQIVLLVVIVGLVYVLLNQILTPIRFQKEQKVREAAVIERLKDIRTAQRAYKQKYQQYTSSFDVLINFILNDSIAIDGNKAYVMAADTVFGMNKLTVDQIKNLAKIPYGNGRPFLLDAAVLNAGSDIEVPVFECKAPYKDFLDDMDQQELVNLIDICKNTLNKYPGLKVGALDQATNDAGNWE